MQQQISLARYLEAGKMERYLLAVGWILSVSNAGANTCTSYVTQLCIYRQLSESQTCDKTAALSTSSFFVHCDCMDVNYMCEADLSGLSETMVGVKGRC